MNCKWCGTSVEHPAKAHVTPPCEAAPDRIKKKWRREQPQRDRIKEALDVITEIANIRVEETLDAIALMARFQK